MAAVKCGLTLATPGEELVLLYGSVDDNLRLEAWSSVLPDVLHLGCVSRRTLVQRSSLVDPGSNLVYIRVSVRGVISEFFFRRPVEIKALRPKPLCRGQRKFQLSAPYG